MSKFIKGVLVASGVVIGATVSAQAAPTNYHPCLDVAGQGFGGLACTVAAGDVFDFGGGDIFTVHNSGNDNKETVEAALRWVFGEEYPLVAGAEGLEGDTLGFDFTPNNITSDSSFKVDLDQAYTFATVKAATYFVIFDVRDWLSLELGTDGFIVNEVLTGPPHDRELKINPIEVSHVGFWNAFSDDEGPDPSGIPVPGALGLLGIGLIGLGVARRRR